MSPNVILFIEYKRSASRWLAAWAALGAARAICAPFARCQVLADGGYAISRPVQAPPLRFQVGVVHGQHLLALRLGGPRPYPQRPQQPPAQHPPPGPRPGPGPRPRHGRQQQHLQPQRRQQPVQGQRTKQNNRAFWRRQGQGRPLQGLPLPTPTAPLNKTEAAPPKARAGKFSPPSPPTKKRPDQPGSGRLHVQQPPAKPNLTPAQNAPPRPRPPAPPINTGRRRPAPGGKHPFPNIQNSAFNIQHSPSPNPRPFTILPQQFNPRHFLAVP